MSNSSVTVCQTLGQCREWMCTRAGVLVVCVSCLPLSQHMNTPSLLSLHTHCVSLSLFVYLYSSYLTWLLLP